MRLSLLFILPLCAVPVFSDVVTLRDGTRLEGKILAEKEDGLEIEIGRNETGTIRRVLVIHSSEIRSWMADEAGRGSPETSAEVERLSGNEYIARLLREAEQKIQEKAYDEGIAQFDRASDLAVEKLDSLEPPERVEALKLRAHALRLQLAALEGKENLLKNQYKGVAEELEERQRKWQSDWSTFERNKESQLERGEYRAELGSRRIQTDIVRREEELKLEQVRIQNLQRELTQRLDQNQRDLLQTQTRIRLVKERESQAETDARAAERTLRR